VRAAALTTLLALGAAALAAGSPSGTQIVNTAKLDGPGIPSNPVTLTVGPICSIKLTPTSPTNLTGRPGDTFRYSFDLEQTGNNSDPLMLSATEAGGAPVSVDPRTLQLSPGEKHGITLVLNTDEAREYRTTITANCGESVQTGGTVGSGTLIVRVSIIVTAKTTLLLPITQKMIDETGLLAPGSLVHYTVRVQNPNDDPLPGVKVGDLLDSHLTLIEAPGAQIDGQQLNWTIDLAPREVRDLRVTARLPLDADELSIPNIASVTFQDFAPIPTNPVYAKLWGGKLNLQKTANRSSADVGDTVNYTVTLKNASRTASFDTTTITDVLPAGMDLIPGSLKLNGVDTEDTNPDPMITEVNGAELPAGKVNTLTYSARVRADALSGTGLLKNVVNAFGTREQLRVDSNEAQYTVRLVPHASSDIVGQVFLDQDANGSFSPGDRPVIGARVMLSDGPSSISDAQGRYSMLNVRPGRYGLLLDPRSVIDPATRTPGDLGIPGARLIQVYGLTTANFPLQAPSGSGQAQRQNVTLILGDVSLEKTLSQPVLDASGPGYTLKIDYRLSSTTAKRVQLRDPLPPGAKLTAGQLTWNGVLRPETPVTFHAEIHTSGPTERSTTDPELTAGEP